MASHHQVLVCLLAVLGACVLCTEAGVIITTLPQSLIVTTTVNNQPITASTQLVYLQDNLEVTWQLNASYVGTDCSYQMIQIRLCYGAPSYQGRPWRAPNTDLSLSKQCLPTPIAVQPYTSTCGDNSTGSVVLPMNSTVWQATMDTPGAFYFVRVYALNSTSSGASPGANAVAMGQSTDPTYSTNLFQVVAYSGVTVSLDIVVIVLSVASYALLFGFFLYERHMKKNK